jgi:hypothetical protein
MEITPKTKIYPTGLILADEQADYVARNSHCSDSSGSVPTKAEVLKAIYESGVHQDNPTMIKTFRRDGKIVEEPSVYAMNFAKCLAQNQGEIM